MAAPIEASAGASVLVVDDDRTSRDLIAALLRAEGHTVETCEDGSDAIVRVMQGGIDLVLLDIVMPRVSGTDACRMIKGVSTSGFLPIILVTAKNDAASRAEGLRMGADDFVGKPFDPEELKARVAAMLRIRRLVGAIAEDRDRLLRRSVHDELTGLPNRKLFELRVAEERKRSERHHEPFACVLVDLAGLSGAPPGAAGARDAAGQSAFDRAFMRGALALKRSVREGDVVARYGETTLAALLPHTHFAGAISASERILQDVASALGDVETWMANVSIGAALHPSRDSRTPETLLSAAEAALEEARRAGGGCVCVAQQRKYLYTPGTPAPRSERFPAASAPAASAPAASAPAASAPASTPASAPVGSSPAASGPVASGPASALAASSPAASGPAASGPAPGAPAPGAASQAATPATRSERPPPSRRSLSIVPPAEPTSRDPGDRKG
jgi:diguanylate cyclase (GGDEF)-like protein